MSSLSLRVSASITITNSNLGRGVQTTNTTDSSPLLSSPTYVQCEIHENALRSLLPSPFSSGHLALFRMTRDPAASPHQIIPTPRSPQIQFVSAVRPIGSAEQVVRGSDAQLATPIQATGQLTCPFSSTSCRPRFSGQCSAVLETGDQGVRCPTAEPEGIGRGQGGRGHT